MGVIRKSAGIIEDLIEGKGLAGVALKYASIKGEDWLREKIKEKSSILGGQRGKKKKVIEDIKDEYKTIIKAPQAVRDFLEQSGKKYQYKFGMLAEEDDYYDTCFPTIRDSVDTAISKGRIVIKAVPFFLVHDAMYAHIKTRLENNPVSIDCSNKTYCEALNKKIVDAFEKTMKKSAPNTKEQDDSGAGWYIVGVNTMYPWPQESVGHCYVWKPKVEDCERKEKYGVFTKLKFSFKKRALPHLASNSLKRLSARLGTMNDDQVNEYVQNIKKHWYK